MIVANASDVRSIQLFIGRRPLLAEAQALYTVSPLGGSDMKSADTAGTNSSTDNIYPRLRRQDFLLCSILMAPVDKGASPVLVHKLMREMVGRAQLTPRKGRFAGPLNPHEAAANFASPKWSALCQGTKSLPR